MLSRWGLLLRRFGDYTDGVDIGLFWLWFARGPLRGPGLTPVTAAFIAACVGGIGGSVAGFALGLARSWARRSRPDAGTGLRGSALVLLSTYAGLVSGAGVYATIALCQPGNSPAPGDMDRTLAWWLGGIGPAAAAFEGAAYGGFAGCCAGILYVVARAFRAAIAKRPK